MRDPGPAGELLVRQPFGKGIDAIPLTHLSLNERELARQEARAKKDRETVAAFAEIGITPAEASLLNVVHYGLTVPPSDLCRRAAGCDYSLGGRVTLEENQAALVDCLSKIWLQIVDAAALGRIQDEIRGERLLGPIYDYPALGGVEFTHAGAEQWFRICTHLWDGGRDAYFEFCDAVHEKTWHYFRSESAAVAERDRWKGYECVASVSGPYPIGPWRAQWWRRYPEGYHIHVEQRMQWQGRCSSGGGHCFLQPMKLPFDPARARDVLDRHNVALVEWLVMTSLEHATDQRGIVGRLVTDRGLKRLGISLTEVECLSGLEACRRNGWLRRVDEHAIAEIRNLLRADAAVMPVPFEPERHWVEFDFTVEGAQLYRMVSAEILGPEWEDGLAVEDTYYREEHRYCTTKEGLATVLQEYSESHETPKSVRTVPIGSWCVHWWQRFRSGYRLELTFGDP